MTSIFSTNSLFNKEAKPTQTAQYSFGQSAPTQSSNVLDNCFDQKYQNQRQQDKNSNEHQQMSLFVDNLIFEDKLSENNEEVYDNQACAQIESDLLDMLDDEPVETTSRFDQFDTKSQENNTSAQDSIGDELQKKTSYRDFSPVSPSTQASEDANCYSLFSASSNDSVFQSPTFCQQTFQDVKIQDFALLMAEGTPEVEKKTCCEKSEICENQTNNFEFPDGGWECSQCSNYNFKGRSSCFRCKKFKDVNDTKGKPAHMQLTEEEKAAQKAAKALKYQNKKQWQQKKNIKSQDKKKVSSGHTRPGDWSCYRCQNFNYSFRDCCNKCGLMQNEHNYYTANFAPNSINFNNVQMQAQTAFNQPQGQLYYFNQPMGQGQQQSNTQMFAFVPQQIHQQQQQWFPSC